MKSSTKYSVVFVLSVSLLLTCSLLLLDAQAEASFQKMNMGDNLIRIQTGAGNPIIDIQLLENTDHCFVDCYSILKIHPYQDVVLPSQPDSEFGWKFVKEKEWMAGLESYDFEILEIAEYVVEIPEYGKAFIKTTCYHEDNSTYECEVQDTVQTGAHEEARYREEYRPFGFWGETLKANQDYVIKLHGKKPLELGTNNIEWIPTIKGFEFNEWSWWNTSFVHKKQINVSDTSGVSINDYPIVVERFDCNGNCNSDGSDLRVVNETSGEKIPFGLKKYNATAFDLAFKVNTVGGGTLTDIYVYYGDAAASHENVSWDVARNNLYDNFPGSLLNNSLWVGKTSGSGSISVGSNTLTLCSGTTIGSGAQAIGIPRFNLSQYNVNMTTLLATSYGGSTLGSCQEYGFSGANTTAGAGSTSPKIMMFKLYQGATNCGNNYDDYTTFKIGLYNGSQCLNDSPAIIDTFTSTLTHYFNFTSFNQTIKITNASSSSASHNWQNTSAYFYASNCDRPLDKCVIVQSVKAYIFIDPAPSYSIGLEDGCPYDDTYINEAVTYEPWVCSIPDAGAQGVLIINASNLVVNCNGMTLNGTGSGVGVYNRGFHNVTLQDCKVQNYASDIKFDNDLVAEVKAAASVYE